MWNSVFKTVFPTKAMFVNKRKTMRGNETACKKRVTENEYNLS